MTSWMIKLPYPTPPISLNGRIHWTARYRLEKQLHGDAINLARHHKLPTGLTHVEIVLHWRPASRRPRDEDNIMPTLKPLTDGLIEYGLVPDDDNTHVTSKCVIEPIGRYSATWLTITESGEPA